ncbi:MAG: hypothetical protein VXX50_01635 [Candidatus Thermoplasmatota archaeon]|nr:hypothetical protein [Candidatus Thermoplasmatota archaeon]
MKRVIVLIMLVLFSGFVQASPITFATDGLSVISEPGAIEKTGSVGGLGINIGIGNLSNSTGEISSEDWPVIAEVYTATWCGNCLDSEDAVSEISTTREVEILHYHREYSEIRDPFGTEVGDDRWIARFGPTNVRATGGLERLPPAVVFNGEWLHSGSVAKGYGNLSDDYALSADIGSTLNLDDISASLSWTPNGDELNGTVDWSVSEEINSMTMKYDIWDDPCSDPDSASITPILYVVEEIARDENGSNGLEFYPHVIRDIHELPWNSPANITLPEIWDGEDFRLVLVFDWEMQFISTECVGEIPVSGFLPTSGFVSTLLILSLASIVIRKK